VLLSTTRYFGAFDGTFAWKSAVSAASITASVTAVPAVPNGALAVKPAYRFKRSLSILSAMATTAGLHINPQKIRNCENFRHIRNLEGCFGVRIEHDLCVAEIWVLCLHSAPLAMLLATSCGAIGTFTVSPA